MRPALGAQPCHLRFGCPRAPTLGPHFPGDQLPGSRVEGGARVRAPGAGDTPESPLPGPSHPGEAGGEGLATRFGFRFSDEPEGDRR